MFKISGFALGETSNVALTTRSGISHSYVSHISPHKSKATPLVGLLLAPELLCISSTLCLRTSDYIQVLCFPALVHV